MPDAKPLSRWTFVLKINDRPGAMELVAATFAHRGISLHALLGNDNKSGADGLATVLVTFSAPVAKKEAMKATLGRLSRVVSVTERTQADASLRKCALVRVAATSDKTPADAMSIALETMPCTIESIACDRETGETIYMITGTVRTVDGIIRKLRGNGTLKSVTQAVLAL